MDQTLVSSYSSGNRNEHGEFGIAIAGSPVINATLIPGTYAISVTDGGTATTVQANSNVIEV